MKPPKLAVPVARAPEPAMQALPEIVAGVDALYDDVRTFKATFKQRYIVKAYDKTKDSAGLVSFEKPNKMSWRYGNGNRVVSDGQLVKIYDSANQQLYETALAKTQYPSALWVLMGQGGLGRDYKVSKLDSEACLSHVCGRDRASTQVS